MNSLIALYIWFIGALGLPTDTFEVRQGPGCGQQQAMSAETTCDDDSDDPGWYYDRTTHIYNGF